MNRAPAVALITLGLLATLCVAAAVLGLGLERRYDGTPMPRKDVALEQAEAALLESTTRTPQASAAPAPLQMLLPQSPQLPLGGSVSPLGSAPAAAPPAPPLRTSPPPQAPATPSAPRPTLPLDKQLKNPQAMEAVLAARALREQGDMQAAVDSLKSADLREPNHPEILGEMALTYEEMGLSSRAEPLWRQIYTMGEANAGGYHALASSKISNPAPGAESPPGPSVPIPLSLGTCRLTREPLPKQGGERLTVHVPIQANPGATIDPGKIEIHVFIYESVNDGARVEQVPQNKMSPQQWSTLPLNWAEPVGEIAQASYDFFPQRPGTTDTRTFHGYSVKFFYQNKLVGEQAEPDSLRKGPPKGATSPGVDNALFPK